MSHKKYTSIQFYESSVSAGFPSPADDFWDKSLNLHEYLISKPEATYLVRVSGDSMIGAGINNSDILIVDRSLNPKNNSIVVAAVDGEFTVKRFKNVNNQVHLVPENKKYPVLKVNGYDDFEVFGVVTGVVRRITN